MEGPCQDQNPVAAIGDLANAVGRLDEEGLWSASSADEARDPLGRLVRAVTRAWAAVNPEPDRDFFNPVSWMVKEHFAPIVGMGATEADTRQLRDALVAIALVWQERFGVAPAITSAISELDAALLMGATEEALTRDGLARTAVTPGYDFIHEGLRYQIKANRPSGKPGSPVRIVGQAKNLNWDRLIWVLYDQWYVMQEAWMWTVQDYEEQITPLRRVSPSHMREGIDLFAGQT